MAATLIVSSSGIRGVVGAGLGPAVAARYGAAFGVWLARAGATDRAVLGRDSRVTGEILADAAAAGLRAAGIGVRDAGVAPTPTLLLAAGDSGCAALIVTASHNPIEWNGLKLGGVDGAFLSPAAGAEVQRLYEADPPLVGWERVGGREPLAGAVEHHVERILALEVVDREAVSRRGFLVALDCVRGAAGRLMSILLRRLGCDVVGIHLEPDGRFPRSPEPVAENLGELARLVQETGADLGMAVDPDGDRLALVDEEGEPLGEDWTLALAVEHVLSVRPGPVVTNLSSSQSIEDAAARAGVPCHRSPVGEANVAARIARTGAVVGGEGNGGVILPELHRTRDAGLAAALVLSLLARRGVSLHGVLRPWPRYHIVKRRLPRPAGPLEPAFARLRRVAGGAETDETDGLRLAWPERREWLHVRASGTEPILRVVAEAPVAERAEELAGVAVAALGETAPDSG